MLKSCYANSKFSWYGLGSRYQFKACELLFLIEKDSVMSQKAIETKIQAWIGQEPWIQYWVFMWIFKNARVCYAQLFQSKSIRVIFWSYMEHVRSTISTKISCNYELKIWFSSIIFLIFFTWFLCKSYPIQSNSP